MADSPIPVTVVPPPAAKPVATTIVAPDAAPKPSDKDEVKAGKKLKDKGLKVAEPDDEQQAGTKMPNVGETVHYVLPYGGKRGEHRPMVVTSITTPNRAGVAGHVLLEPADGTGDTHDFQQDVPYNPDKLVGTWHYVETE